MSAVERGYLSEEMDRFYPEDFSEGMSAFGGRRLGPT